MLPVVLLPHMSAQHDSSSLKNQSTRACKAVTYATCKAVTLLLHSCSTAAAEYPLLCLLLCGVVLLLLPGTAHSQQATRHARRVYVGGLPPTANEQGISTFFSHALAAVGGNTAGPGGRRQLISESIGYTYFPVPCPAA